MSPPVHDFSRRDHQARAAIADDELGGADEKVGREHWTLLQGYATGRDRKARSKPPAEDPRATGYARHNSIER